MSEVYSTSLSEIIKKEKKPKAKRVQEIQEEAGVVPPVKKQRTEAQIAAAEKRKLAAAEKKAAKAEAQAADEAAKQIAAANAAAEKVIKDKALAEQAAAKKAAAAEKRRLKREAKIAEEEAVQEATPSEESVPVTVKPFVVQKKPSTTSSEAVSTPKHITKFAEKVIKEKTMSSKIFKPRKQIKREAQEAANQMWNDPEARDKFEKSQARAEKSLYQSIFPRRK